METELNGFVAVEILVSGLSAVVFFLREQRTAGIVSSCIIFLCGLFLLFATDLEFGLVPDVSPLEIFGYIFLRGLFFSWLLWRSRTREHAQPKA